MLRGHTDTGDDDFINKAAALNQVKNEAGNTQTDFGSFITIIIGTVAYYYLFLKSD